MPLSPEERSLRGRLAVLTSWANTADPSARTAPARAAAMSRFEEEARKRHPDASDAQIARIADHLKRAHFTRLSFLAAKSRREKARGAAT